LKDPIIQYAIDVTSIKEAISLAHLAVDAGVDWLEVGNPLVKFEGMHAIKALREEFPDQYILADLMILSGSERYINAAKDFGANNVTITALAPDQTVQEAINLCKDKGIESTVDLFNKNDVIKNAKKYEEMGANFIMVHYGVDQKRFSTTNTLIEDLRKVVEQAQVPISYATYNSEEGQQAVNAGASIIVQGSPFLSTYDLKNKLENFIKETTA